MGYIGEYASNSFDFASENGINVMLNDQNVKNKIIISLVLKTDPKALGNIAFSS